MQWLKEYEKDFLRGNISQEELMSTLGSWLKDQVLDPNLFNPNFYEALTSIQEEKKRKGLIIRPAREDDLVYNLNRAFHKELGLKYNPRNPHLAPADCDVLEIDENERRVITGVMWSALEPAPEFRNQAYIDILFIEQRFRGKGFGKDLIDNLEARLPSRFEGISLYAPLSALIFYQNIGFIDSGHETSPTGTFANRTSLRLFKLYKPKA